MPDDLAPSQRNGHVPTMHRRGSGIIWSCSCGAKSERGVWWEAVPAAIADFARHHVIPALTDELEATRTVVEKACQLCDDGYEYGIDEEPRKVQELQAAVDAYRSVPRA